MARKLLLIVCLAALAAGCNTQGPDEGKLILAYTRWGDPAEMESTRELIAQFERENPDIAVRVDVVSWGQYWQKMKTAVVTGTAQDVWLISPAYVEEYASAGHLLDLTPYIESDPTFDIKDYFPRAFDDFSFIGEGWGSGTRTRRGPGTTWRRRRRSSPSISTATGTPTSGATPGSITWRSHTRSADRRWTSNASGARTTRRSSSSRSSSSRTSSTDTRSTPRRRSRSTHSRTSSPEESR